LRQPSRTVPGRLSEQIKGSEQIKEADKGVRSLFREQIKGSGLFLGQIKGSGQIKGNRSHVDVLY